MINLILIFIFIVLCTWLIIARRARKISEAKQLLNNAKHEWYKTIGQKYEEIRQRDMVHNCSLKVSMSAKDNPKEYVYKYFYKGKNDITKRDFEWFCQSAYKYRLKLYSEATALRDNYCQQLNQQTLSTGEPLTKYINPTWGILPPQKPKFLFSYISPKGRSQNFTTVFATQEVLEYIKQKEEWKNSAAGQRALMNSKLREEILKRDNYTCRKCGISIKDEPHLLLEVDHIIPVSKGGKTVADNLQTLCWSCNRSKSNK